MTPLRATIEGDLSDTLEGEFASVDESDTGLITLTDPTTGAVYADLRGRVQYDFKEVTPSGEMIVVRDPMITLRLSSLPRVPQAGEKWAITFPPNPADPTPKMYMLGGTRAPRLSASIGFIMLFPIQVVQQ